jgi:hypothetical protein
LLFIAGIVSAIRFTSQQKKNDSNLDIEPTNQEIQEVQETQEVPEVQEAQEAQTYSIV